MNTWKVSCLLFTLSMILISHSLMAASSESLYESVCKETKDPACLPLLKSDPQITMAKNYSDLSKFILEFAVKKAKEGQMFMKQIAKTHPTQRIILCANSFYNSTILSFISAKNELIEYTMSANYEAKFVGDGPDYCAQALSAAKIENPHINKIVALLSTTAFLATEHLH